MNTGKIEVIYGNGYGKTSMAIGRGLLALTARKDVIMIQFLKGNQKQDNLEIIERLEPEMKVFRFEKSGCYFDQLTEAQKQEEYINIRNGLNYAKKVLTTGECEVLILDEVLGLLDQCLLTEAELKQLLECRDEADVILSGKVLPDWLREMADRVVCISQDKS